jgi:hypothetical protein
MILNFLLICIGCWFIGGAQGFGLFCICCAFLKAEE